VNDIVFDRPGVGAPPSAQPEPEPEPVVTVTAAEPIPIYSTPNWAAIGIFLLLLLAGMAYAREFLMPVALAFLLALVFTPVRRFLNRRGVPSWVAALLVVGVLLTVIIGGIVLLSGPVSDWITRAPTIFGQLQAKMHGVASPLPRSPIRSIKLPTGRPHHKRRRSSSSSRAWPPRSR